MSTRTRRRLIIPALLAMLCGVLLAGQAQATGPAAATGPAGQPAVEEEDQAIDEDGNGLTDCAGGPQEMSLARMNDQPTNLVENGAFAPLPGAVMNFAVPQNDNDQIMVTFSAEARLQGQTGAVVAPVDVPMNPLNDLSFTTDAGQADATQACHRIGPGQHTLRVVWLLVDQGANDVLTGTLDDWTLHLEIND